MSRSTCHSEIQWSRSSWSFSGECFAIMTCLESLKGPCKGSPSGYTLFCVSLLKLYISVENWVMNTLTGRLSYLKPKPWFGPGLTWLVDLSPEGPLRVCASSSQNHQLSANTTEAQHGSKQEEVALGPLLGAMEGAHRKLTCVGIEHQNLPSSRWLTRH